MTRRVFLFAIVTATLSCSSQATSPQRAVGVSGTTGMATTIYALAQRTTMAGSADVNYDITPTGITIQGGGEYLGQFWPTNGGTKIPMQNAYQYQQTPPSAPSGLTYDWISWRLASDVTLTGTTVTIQHAGRLFSTFDAAKATFRFELSKITSSGNVETVLGTVDEPAVASSETNELTLYSVNMTITPMTLAAGERLVLRSFLIPAPGQTMVAQATPLHLGFGLTSGTSGRLTSLTFSDTFTLASNTTRLYQRRTTTIGIGNFQDLLTTKVTQSAAVASVNVPGGSSADVQYLQGDTAVRGTVANDANNPAINDTSNVATYTSGSFVPAVNTLYLLPVLETDAAPEATHPTITTTTGLNFVEIASVPFATIASNTHRLTLFRAMKSSGLSTGTYTVNLADAGTGVVANLYKSTGNVYTTGTDGANAVLNVITNSADSGANPSITFGSFAQGYNPVFVVLGFSATPAITPGTGWTTSLTTGSIATPTAAMNPYTSPTAQNFTSTQTAINWGGIGIEVALTTPASGTPLEWISPRLAGSWQFDLRDSSLTAIGAHMAGFENTLSADATMKLRVYRWRAGVETLVYEYKHSSEFGTSNTNGTAFTNAAQQTYTPTPFQADDRIVLRLYGTPTGSTFNASGYVGLNYDNGSATFPTAYIDLFDLPVNPFKLETDPATPATIPNALTLLGLQN